MPRMTFKDIFDEIETITTISSNKRKVIKNGVQRGLDMIANSFNWPWLMEETFITTVAPHETGNVDVTNGSKVVSGGSTSPVFTTAMVGRKFRIADEEAFYTIAGVASDSEILLEQPYQGDTDTDQSYKIFKDEYRLPANLDKLKVMRQIENAVSMVGIQASAFDLIEPTPNAEASPNFYLVIGSKKDTYSTGTVSATAGASIITGVSTAWTGVDGLSKQNRITIGSNVYTIKKVNSATQVTIYENIISTVSGTTYSINMDNLIVQFFDIPDAVENIYFRFQRIPEVLFGDTDIPDIPMQWIQTLITAGLSIIWQTKDKDEAQRQRGNYLFELNEMKKSISNIAQHTVYPRRTMVESFIFPKGPKTTANRGRPFSL